MQKIYQLNWTEGKNESLLQYLQSEKLLDSAIVDDAEITASDFGATLKVSFSNGTCIFISLSRDSRVPQIGDHIAINTCTIVHLVRGTAGTCVKVRIE